MQRFDILILSDLRLSGGVTTALVEQTKANAKAGYSTGFVNVWSSLGRPRQPVDWRVRRLLDSGELVLADPHRPIDAGLVVGMHPALFANLPQKPINICGYRKLLLVTQAPFDGYSQPLYDTKRIDDNVQEVLGGEVQWVPINPVVRSLLGQSASPLTTLSADWAGVLDPDEWKVSREAKRADGSVIGRQGRPDPMRWPDTAAEALQAYPAQDDLVVRIRGETPLRSMLGEYPPNWRVMPRAAVPQRAFLGAIDHYVYFHHSRHVDGYGYAILEAMAAGAVPILPESFRAQLDGAAVYGRPKDVTRIVNTFRQCPDRLQKSSEAATTTVRERFAHRVHQERVRDLIGPPRGSRVAIGRRRRRVMFLSSNGIGLGHLTRQLAIARRCDDWIETVFVTMSQAVSIVGEFGYLCEYIPHQRHLRCDADQWNRFLARELVDKIAFYDIGAVLFDGNVVYSGLAEVLSGLPDCWRIWCRRAMWRRGVGSNSIVHEPLFDLVVEPGEIAAELDAGLTAGQRKRTRRVNPIRLLDTSEQLSRADARKALSISEDRIAVLVQLGAGNNRQSRDVEEAVIDYLSRADQVHAMILDWPIADRQICATRSFKPISTYPAARYLRAFDATVSAAGYNSFHDIVANGIPAAFMPNENPMMDDQLARAHHATMHGYGLMLREHDPYAVAGTLDRLLDPAERARMRAAAARFRVGNGASEVARLVKQLMLTVRADSDHRDELLPAMHAAAF